MKHPSKARAVQMSPHLFLSLLKFNFIFILRHLFCSCDRSSSCAAPNPSWVFPWGRGRERLDLPIFFYLGASSREIPVLCWPLPPSHPSWENLSHFLCCLSRGRCLQCLFSSWVVLPGNLDAPGTILINQGQRKTHSALAGGDMLHRCSTMRCWNLPRPSLLPAPGSSAKARRCFSYSFICLVCFWGNEMGPQCRVCRGRDSGALLSTVLVTNWNGKNCSQRTYRSFCMLSQIPMASIYAKCCTLGFIERFVFLASFSERSRASINSTTWKSVITPFFFLWKIFGPLGVREEAWKIYL